jgi:hypothetical protein
MTPRDDHLRCWEARLREFSDDASCHAVLRAQSGDAAVNRKSVGGRVGACSASIRAAYE